MNFIEEYKYVIIPISIWFLIQISKVITDLIKNKKLNIKRFMGAGGMPSSHSAVVTSLATLIGKHEGFDTPVFGLSLIFACVVMYDAAGIRRAAGKHASMINKIMENHSMKEIKSNEKLAEVLGHTPFQVLVGAILGIIVGIIF